MLFSSIWKGQTNLRLKKYFFNEFIIEADNKTDLVTKLMKMTMDRDVETYMKNFAKRALIYKHNIDSSSIDNFFASLISYGYLVEKDR